MEMHYYYYPESIVTANTTWLGDHFDSTLLYGSLVEGYTFMKGETDMVALYSKRLRRGNVVAQENLATARIVRHLSFWTSEVSGHMIMNDIGVLLGGVVQVQTTQNRGP